VQVITDLLGMTDWQPKHARPFADLRGTILDAARRYAQEVAEGTFPGAEQTVRMDDTVLDDVLGRNLLDQPMSEAPIPLDRDL
jgi:3-methyl-2-oxobutanoate hydroxymethyltransferase